MTCVIHVGGAGGLRHVEERKGRDNVLAVEFGEVIEFAEPTYIHCIPSIQ